MRPRIVAIPMFAAIWLGAPAPARAQDQDAATKVQGVIAAVEREQPRRAEPSERERLRDGGSQDAGSPVMAEQRRGSGGGRGAGPGGGRGSGGGRGPGGGAAGPPPNGGGRGVGPGSGGPRGGGDVQRRRPPIVYGNPRSGNRVNVNVYARPYARPFYAPSYYDRWARGVYGWSPLAYAPWAFIYGTAGYASLGYSYGPYDAYGGYGYGGYGSGSYYGPYGPFGRGTTFDTGGVRLKIRPRDAQVFVDGYYAGVVDDFDGTFQSLRLEQGGHKIEVRMPGYETFTFDVHIQPDRKLVLKEDLRARP